MSEPVNERSGSQKGHRFLLLVLLVALGLCRLLLHSFIDGFVQFFLSA